MTREYNAPGAIGEIYFETPDRDISDPKESKVKSNKDLYQQGNKSNAEALAFVTGEKKEPDYLYFEGGRVGQGGVEVGVSSSYFVDPVGKWDKFIGDVLQTKNCAFIGASVGEGSSAGTSEDKRKYSIRAYLNKALQVYCNTANYGYICGKNQNLYVPDTDTTGSWTYVADSSAFGGGYMESTEAGRNNTCKGTFRYVRLVYEAGFTGTFQLRIGTTPIHTLDLSAGSGVTQSPVYDMGSLAFHDFRIVASGTEQDPCRVYGWYFYDVDPSVQKNVSFSAYVLGGMATSDVPDSVIDNYCLEVDTPVITLLMYNDTDANILRSKTQRMIDNCKENGRMIVLFSTVSLRVDVGKWPNDNVFRELAQNNDNAIYCNLSNMIGPDDYDDGIELHPNQLGHRGAAGYFCKNMGLKLPNYSDMA